MRSLLLLSTHVLCLLFVSSCHKPGGDESTGARPPPTRVTGTIHGVPSKMKYAVYFWRDKADDMMVALSDRDNICPVLSRGVWPSQSDVLMLMLKHNRRENRDTPFTAGRYPLRGSAELLPQDTKAVRFVHFDQSCGKAVQDRAVTGTVEITTSSIGETGEAKGSFDVTLESGDRVSGDFTASSCPSPTSEPSGCDTQ